MENSYSKLLSIFKAHKKIVCTAVFLGQVGDGTPLENDRQTEGGVEDVYRQWLLVYCLVHMFYKGYFFAVSYLCLYACGMSDIWFRASRVLAIYWMKLSLNEIKYATKERRVRKSRCLVYGV